MARVIFYPEAPYPGQKVYHILKALRIPWSHHAKPNFHPRQDDLVIYWDRRTTKNPDPHIEKLIRVGAKVLNPIWDVSKSQVDFMFSYEFGYSTLLDPEISRGRAVKKSEAQYSHDGVIVELPQKKETGFIFQRLIDTRIRGDLQIDHRLVIIDRKPVTVIVKYIAAEEMFGIKSLDMALVSPSKVFTSDFLKNVGEFCNLMDLDFGELDILIHSDGTPYIVDVNNMAGAAAFQNESRGRELLEIYSKYFKKAYFNDRRSHTRAH